MGMYVNPGNSGFSSIRKGLYVDKTGLIQIINSRLGTKDKLICVSRPRRFGKSFAAQMLCAYYDKSCDSKGLFAGFEISENSDFETYMNKYDVLYLDITWFISNEENRRDIIAVLQKKVIAEFREIWPQAKQENTLPETLYRITEWTGNKFIVIIDEWDALFREAKEDIELQEEYIRLLRGLFKSSGQTDKMIEAAYMTGILPIKKYGTQSALTDFREYTMLRPAHMAKYMGFTEAEVKKLCEEYNINFDEMKQWYDGYSFYQEKSVYSPNSVIEAVKNREFGTYWTETETYEALKGYINENMDGLKDAILSMLAGEKCKIVTRKFQNDMIHINSKDDVLTLLIHLGYTAYCPKDSTVYIPNLEVSEEFKNAVEDSGWRYVSDALKDSEELLAATLKGDSQTVAEKIQMIHSENTSILSYNDENSLSCVITLAYYFARKDYVIERELPTGKGFADIVFRPRKYCDKPAIIVELKWNKSAQGAIWQIKDRQYPKALKEYSGKLLLVGINYDKKKKEHSCEIEEYSK